MGEKRKQCTVIYGQEVRFLPLFAVGNFGFWWWTQCVIYHKSQSIILPALPLWYIFSTGTSSVESRSPVRSASLKQESPPSTRVSSRREWGDKMTLSDDYTAITFSSLRTLPCKQGRTKFKSWQSSWKASQKASSNTFNQSTQTSWYSCMHIDCVCVMVFSEW